MRSSASESLFALLAAAPFNNIHVFEKIDVSMFQRAQRNFATVGCMRCEIALLVNHEFDHLVLLDQHPLLGECVV